MRPAHHPPPATGTQRAVLAPVPVRPPGTRTPAAKPRPPLRRPAQADALAATLSRVVARRTSGPVLQRRIAVTLPAYSKGIGIPNTANLTQQQLSAYWRLAVSDDLDFVRAHAKKAQIAGKTAEWDGLAQAAAKTNETMANRVDALNRLVASINAYWDNEMTPEVWDSESGSFKKVPLLNSQTRYSSNPSDTWSGFSSGYLNKDLPQVPHVGWRDDRDMWRRFGDGFGRLQNRLPDVNPRGLLSMKDKDRNAPTTLRLPVARLRWAEARTLLPRPLLNLLFDVRYQLEADDGTFIDERTPTEIANKQASPNYPGALRSWHTDSPQVLPPNEFDTNDIPDYAEHLHAHYSEHSQGGTGSSQEIAVDQPKKSKQKWKQKKSEVQTEDHGGPIGYAEYTGTGSDYEHNTKIVLDYIGKHVYLTLTHYCYWALLTLTNNGYEAWNSGTQSLSQAEGKLDQRRKEGDVTAAQMMNPWIEIVMP